ncbi:MAG: NYN domain-containing protein [Pseudomonadota bacterium]|nr:NYN domain-containing protein [Pseudomonadota bacterium]
MPDAAATTPRARLALLIDADNLGGKYLPIIIREASALGTITVKRVYGHFASNAMNSWQPLIHENALTPIHVPPAATGKNATDMKLAIEAMDILHRGLIDGFCIASSDSDFTTLASRIREEGVPVYGFGEQKASKAYVRSCDRFFYCDLLANEDKAGIKTTKVKLPAAPEKDILAAIDDVSSEEGWAHLGAVGKILNERAPDFDPRNFGFRKLSSLIESMNSVEMQRPASGGGAIEVRVKPKR